MQAIYNTWKSTRWIGCQRIVIIFNAKNFSAKSKLQKRFGTQKDVGKCKLQRFPPSIPTLAHWFYLLYFEEHKEYNNNKECKKIEYNNK